MEKLNVLYTTDHNYIKPMLVSITSLIVNNPDMIITIHLIYENLEPSDFRLIDQVLRNYTNIDLLFYDYRDLECSLDSYKLPEWRGSKIPNARLFFSHFLSDIDNLLYLDSDTIIVGKLNDLFKYKGPIHMCKDSMNKKHIHDLGLDQYTYYNSGVLWINLKDWEKNNCDYSIEELIFSKKTYEFPDQDIINLALKDIIKPLPTNYDVFPLDVMHKPKHVIKINDKNEIVSRTLDELKLEHENPIILHTTPIYDVRPWDHNIIHPFNKIYEHYANIAFGYIIKEKRPVIKDFIKYAINYSTDLLLTKDCKAKLKKIIK